MAPPAGGKKVVLGVTGGIAAYKAVELCRRLVDAGAHVVPVLTDDALRFVGEVTFSALGSERCHHSLFEDSDPIPHTRLGQSADVVVVAPATARFIGCYAGGIADGLLTATVLATRAPVVVCPAMHTEMWEHPAVQENLATLARRGVRIVPPTEGRLAGGDVGAGRMAEIEVILEEVLAVLAGDPGTRSRAGDLSGRRVLVSAGGTREPVDPVRFIGNRSSGKQGHALAEAASERGAEVVLVTTTSRPGPAGSTVVRVATAAEMEREMLEHATAADVVVMAAAVADFRPKATFPTKLPRSEGLAEIILEPTPDILAELGRRRTGGQVLVGFAAETHEVAERASAKLVAKGVDLIVANDVSAPGVGFDHETNEVLILGSDGSSTHVPLASKVKVANAVLDTVVDRLRDHDRAGGGQSPRSDP
ncbi:MAG TPA: bifunctional phosphopantothenoylcysteine decarboxylase/phosphopantothenate--cysteine ligase CoaBC [Acidimicrobiales bacterium]|nr:bifunctional phosphopantothenoylcysteine decarboxylase/phosphopantothenate--cysteine ligase CoaBC [Acidimicrobiales bacterium]